MTDKKITVEFAPGAFDNFDGTQEELDELIAEITRMAESGELHERSRPIDFDEPTEDDIEASHGKIDQRITITMPVSAISHVVDSKNWVGIKSIIKISIKFIR